MSRETDRSKEINIERQTDVERQTVFRETDIERCYLSVSSLLVFNM